MIYYHITPEINVDSILIAGIIPSKNKKHGLTSRMLPDWNSVFLTNDFHRILSDQAGPRWCRLKQPAVISIDITNLIISPKKYYSGGTYIISDFEYEHVGIIHPSKIVDVKYYDDYKKEIKFNTWQWEEL